MDLSIQLALDALVVNFLLSMLLAHALLAHLDRYLDYWQQAAQLAQSTLLQPLMVLHVLLVLQEKFLL